MNFLIAEDDIKLITALTEQWKHAGSLSALEYDLLLDKIKHLYSEVKFGCDDALAENAEDVLSVTDRCSSSGAAAVSLQTAGRHETFVKNVRSLYDDDIPAVNAVNKSDVADIPAGMMPEPVLQETPAAVETPVAETYASAVETVETADAKYLAPEVAAEEPAPVPQQAIHTPVTDRESPYIPPQIISRDAETAETTVAAPQVLGDLLARHTTTIAESVQAAAVSPGQFANVSSLRDSIGFNDKYMFVRELFGGSERDYEQTVEILDSFTSIEDALIFICDKFGWTRDNEAASRLFDILDAKLK